MQIGFRLVPPAFGPGQGCTSAGEPDLAPQQGGLQFAHLCRGIAGDCGFRLHRDQIHGHRQTREQSQVTGGAAVPQQHQSPGTRQLPRTFATEDRFSRGLPELMG